MPTHILGVCGSMSGDSRTRKMLEIVLGSAAAAGAETRTLDLRETVLPLMDPESKDQGDLPAVKLVRENAVWAEGFVLATPEYHGNQSGALKNWFDFLYPELAGKVAAVIAMTGGGHGDMAIISTKNSFNWCHGFTLPFHAAATSAHWDGDKLNEKVHDRLIRLGKDVVRYAGVIGRAWADAKSLGKGPDAGFAGFHAK
ncbi:MAG: NAD(P)H-dependent oxidoreductase [Planctomycetes bacterium]|nr:NAD(P)H-dependent oxidoreductase [Planctomycetota bacterium]